MLYPSPERGKHDISPFPALDLMEPSGYPLLDMLADKDIIMPDDITKEIDAARLNREYLIILLDGKM